MRYVALMTGIVCAFGSTGLQAVAEELYRTDFATSEGGAETGAWHELVYPVPGTKIINNYGPSRGWTYTADLPWQNATNRVDGWIAGGHQGTYLVGWNIRTNTVAMGSSDRPYFAASINSSSYFDAQFLTPIGNSFSTGTLYLQVDIRAPKSWVRNPLDSASSTSPWNPMVRLFPAFRSTMNNPDLSGQTSGYVGIFGLNGSSSQNGETRNVVHFTGFGNNNTTDSLQGTGSGVSATNLHWYRFLGRFDLNNGKLKAWSKDMGTTMPRADDPTSPDTNATFYSGELKFYRPITSTDPIEGIGFRVGGISSGNPVDLEKAGTFANIKLSWSPTGKDADKELFYTNDAQTRRVRRVTPTPKAFVYTTPASTPIAATFTGYGASTRTDFSDKNNLLEPSNNSQTVPQPIGLDGWRRQNKGGSAIATVADSQEAGGKMMRVSCPVDYGCFMFAMQPLGETFTSGKIRVSFDGRTPDKWYWSSARGLYFCVGTEDLYTADHDHYVAQVVSQVACTSSSNTETPYFTVKSNGTNNRVANASSAFSAWHRVILTIDLDAKTYDVKVYKWDGVSKAASFTPAESQLAFEQQGAPFATSGLDNVATLMVGAYGIAQKPGTWAGSALFDNVKVWKNVGTAQEALVYSNDFDKRIRYSSTQGDNFLTDFDRASPLRDDWKAVPYDGLSATAVRSGANPCLRLAADGTSPALIRDFGSRLAAGKGALDVTVDLRPPIRWEGVNLSKGRAAVVLGGEEYAQANTATYAPFANREAVMFGFLPGAASARISRTTETKLFANSGAEEIKPSVTINPTHWYRFAMSAKPSTKTYALKVYDMGTSQPTAETAYGTLITTLRDLPFRPGADETLGALGLHVTNVSGNTPDDFVLVDNLSVQRRPNGMTIIVR